MQYKLTIIIKIIIIIIIIIADNTASFRQMKFALMSFCF